MRFAAEGLAIQRFDGSENTMPIQRTMHLGGGIGPWEIFVAHVAEGLSVPTVARVTLRPEDGTPIVPSDILGKECVLELREDDETVRAWHLVVRGVEDGGVGLDRSFHLELDDRFGLLALRHDVRIFQELTTKEIVSAVFDKAGINSSSVKWEVRRTLPKLVYCVQHRETDLTFVERLLRHEGIFSFGADSPDEAMRIFADSPSAFAPIDGESSVRLHDGGSATQEAGVRDLEVDYSVVSEEVVLRDWNYEKPDADLTSTAKLGAEPRSSLYEFPGGYQTQSDGKALAEIRLQELVSEAAVARGVSTVVAFRPGRTFELTDATRDPLNCEWLLREVQHEFTRTRGLQGKSSYRSRFVASPMSQPYRPKRVPARPVVHGSHSVRVTGPAGSEIHTDQLGRMKGQFFWDRDGKKDDKSSCWMRVIQLPIGGSQALARVGWEMLVRYAWGDPDRPIAIARVDNAAHPSPYKYPKAASAMSFKTLSSPGGGKFNEFTMEDGGGSMKFGATASKDWNEQVNNDKTEKISVNEKLEVGTDLSTTIGGNQKIQIGAMNSVTIDSDSNVMISGSRTKVVGAAETVTVSGILSEKITGSDTETTGASHTSLAAMGVTRSSKGSAALTVGGSMVQAAALGCSLAVAGSKSETVGGAKLIASGGPVSETMIGAMAITVGGALINTAGGSRTGTAKGTSNVIVGGVAMLNAGKKLQMKAPKIKMTVAGAANFLGGGGIINMTPGSVSFIGIISVSGSSAVKVSGAPNLIG